MRKTSEETAIRGIVLRQVPYGENDAIIECLTKNGRISFKARGILKPSSKNHGCCLLYTFSEFILEKREDKIYLIRGKILRANLKLYQSLEAMAAFGFVAQCIVIFTDQECSSQMFDVFDALETASTDDFDLLTITAIALAKIIEETGYGLNVNQCVRCGSKTKIVAFDYHQGGFCCTRCLNNKKPEDVEYLKSVRYVFNVDRHQFYHYKLSEKISKRLIQEFVQYLEEKFDYRSLQCFELFYQLFY